MIEFGEPNRCYANAYSYVCDNDGAMHYVEGFAYDIRGRVLFQHAWAVDRSERRNYEITQLHHADFAYFGFLVPRRQLHHHWRPANSEGYAPFFSLNELKAIEDLVVGIYPVEYFARTQH